MAIAIDLADSLPKAHSGYGGQGDWSTGVLEYWSIEQRFAFKLFLGVPSLHFSITPSLRGRKRCQKMNLSKVKNLVLALLLILLFVLPPGCQSLKGQRQYLGDERWICPEYADLPLRQGRFEEAINQHLRVLSEEPGNGLAHYHLGYAYGQLGLHPDEAAEYLRAIDLGMESGDLFYNLGMAYMELDEYVRAEQSFRRAVDLEPECGENHRGLGLAFLRQEHYHEALISCRRAVKLEANDPDSWHCLALAAARDDQVGEAWTAVKQLRELNPDYSLDPLLLEMFPSEKKSVGPE
jgi:tetratricopeptide (TPR) repeat protein